MAALEGNGDVAVNSATETDLSLLDLIRQALEASRSSTHPERAGHEDASISRIGKFEVVREIGRGGFGTVLLVRDPDLGRERALKVPNPDTLGSPEALKRFLAEARLASRVDHPNVVRVLEAATLGAFPYIVMEYCPGGSLGQWLTARSNKTPLPQRWVAALVAEIAEGVHQAHLAGLLHRDVKPGNILLERIPQADEPEVPRFRPKIADFGLAKVFEQDGIARSMTVTGTPVGTWAYMSPEQARGDKEIRATTDVYAIGAILSELLTGTRLYAGLSQPEVLSRLLGPEATPTPRSLRKDLHRDLETICRKCLEKKPTDRYQNSSELTNDLHRYLEGLPILARPAPIWKRGVSRLKRQPVRSTLIGIVSTSIVAVSLAAYQYSEITRGGKLEALLNNLETATVAKFPELVPQADPNDSRVANRLKGNFKIGTRLPKLAAALVLGKHHRNSCTCEYCTFSYNQLLIAEPREIAPIAGLLREQRSDLLSRLATEAETPSSAGTSATDAEAQDHRRANAANALICLDPEGQGWQLFRFQPNPQARSFLIHQLGSSGVAPKVIHKKLIEKDLETSIKTAIIQTLGEIPLSEWDPVEQERVTLTVLDLYCDHPDSGIHGSAKWLLLKWKHHEEISKIDKELAEGGIAREGFRWRVSRAGITFAQVDDPETGRVIEVSDTEIPRDLFLKFLPAPDFKGVTCPDPDCPITGISYLIASTFCNAITDFDRLAKDQRCYGAVSKWNVETVDGALDRSGYRLLNDREFRLASRARSSTKRYYGDSTALLLYYAWYDQRTTMQTHPVARLKPNDFGLFDTLGNANEICQVSDAPQDSQLRSVFFGGSVRNFDFNIHCDSNFGPTLVYQRDAVYDVGFRVARTVRTGSRRK